MSNDRDNDSNGGNHAPRFGIAHENLSDDRLQYADVLQKTGALILTGVPYEYQPNLPLIVTSSGEVVDS